MKYKLHSKLLALIVAATSVAVLAACAGSGSKVGVVQCSALTSASAVIFSVPNVRIVDAVVREATAATSTTPALPPHCEVNGMINERAGIDGQSYAIKFHLRMPVNTAWNGKLVFSGGGGSNGVLGDALTVSMLPYTPMRDGYAVVSTDSGHDNAVNTLNERTGIRAFNFDPQARTDLAYNSYPRVTLAAKDLLTAFEGTAPRKSYFMGCSEGGREAAMMTQRFPSLFDGVAAGAPLIDPGPAVSAAADIVQTFAAVAKNRGEVDRNGYPFLGRALSEADLAAINGAVLARCDGLDGAVDGMVHNLAACAKSFDPATLECSPDSTTSCLTADQAGALAKTMEGLKDGAGHQVYPGFFWDAGTASALLRELWLGPANALQSGGALISSLQIASYFTPPPRIDVGTRNGSEVYRTVLAWKPVENLSMYYATSPWYPESPYAQYYSAGSDLSAYRDRGGKMLIYHGASDGVLSAKDSAAWYERINQVNSGKADAFARLFLVPGMGHCRGGPATREFDMLTPLSDWVERGIAPDRIIATAPRDTPWPGRTRPLCPHPQYAQYEGRGSVEVAGNFSCVVP